MCVRPGYVLANVRFTSPERAQGYGRQVPAVIHQYGGRYLARGGLTERMEGEWPVHYLTLVQFPSLDAAKQWYASAEYQAIRTLRSEGAESQVVFFEGVDEWTDESTAPLASDPT
jgi:uncharacterized protein (DUF1330 family)